MAQDLTTTACIGTAAGDGMKTTWLLEGSATAYANATGVTISTDGYKITAAMLWRLLTNATTATHLTLETATAGPTSAATTLAIGACVETYSGTAALAAATSDKGNFAICHWMFVHHGTSQLASVATASAGENAWGQTQHLSEKQWGTSGGAVTGAGAKSGGGTALTLATNGLTLAPIAKAALVYTATDYKQWWYQPKYASTYAAGVLRRYNGGKSDGEKVKGYCVSARLVAGTGSDKHISKGFLAGGEVTLSGAATLVAGAVALGVATLAI